jgi:hypothetical protein
MRKRISALAGLMPISAYNQVVIVSDYLIPDCAVRSVIAIIHSFRDNTGHLQTDHIGGVRIKLCVKAAAIVNRKGCRKNYILRLNRIFFGLYNARRTVLDSENPGIFEYGSATGIASAGGSAGARIFASYGIAIASSHFAVIAKNLSQRQ